jgi:hypothetical protein
MATGFTSRKPPRSARFMARAWWSAGVLRPWHAGRKTSESSESPKAPARGERMKPAALGHERVKSPHTACARVESLSTERTGRRATAGCRPGVLSGIVVGGRESRRQGEGPVGSPQLAKETRACMQDGTTQANLTAGNSNWAVQRATVTVRANASTTCEPDAGTPQVRVCGGGSWEQTSLCRSRVRRRENP